MSAEPSMRWTVYSDQQRKRINIVLTGEVTAAGLLAAQQELWAAEGAHHFDELCDYRGCTASDLLAKELAEHARRENMRIPEQQPRRQAIVVANDAMYGLGRMFQGWYGDGMAEVEIFRSLADAEIWLDGSPNCTR